jgi:hypothetical protein
MLTFIVQVGKYLDTVWLVAVSKTSSAAELNQMD